MQEFQLDAAYLALTGNAVTEALTIASLNAQIATVEGIIRDDQTNLDLVQKEVRAGVATQLDIETATSQLAADRTQLPPLRQQVSVAQHALAVLVGRAPGDWVPPDFDLDRITLPEELPLSLPSALVRQRPDILAADARLHAASAAVGVATAQLYPSITLSAASRRCSTAQARSGTSPAASRRRSSTAASSRRSAAAPSASSTRRSPTTSRPCCRRSARSRTCSRP